MCKLDFVQLFFTRNFQKFLANNILWVHKLYFFKLFPQIWNQRKTLRIFDTPMQKKKEKNSVVIEYMDEYFLELVKNVYSQEMQTYSELICSLKTPTSLPRSV